MGGSFTTDTPLGDFMLGLLVLIGQLESDQMSDRILGNFKYQKENGFYPHKKEFAPLGTKAVTAIPYTPTATKKPKKMLAWDFEQRIIMANIIRLHDVVGLSFRAISDVVEAQTRGYLPNFAESRKWSPVDCAHAYLLEKQYALVQKPRYMNLKALPTRADARKFWQTTKGR
jgi:hypothetical protein